MKYNGFEIRQNIITRAYNIYDVFGKPLSEQNFSTIADAKVEVDNMMEKNKLKRFQPIHYRRYWWGVIDKTTSRYYEKSDGKLLLFKSREDCLKWCDKNNNQP